MKQNTVKGHVVTVIINSQCERQSSATAFCRSPILKKLCAEHGALVAESVHYLENTAASNNPAEVKRRLAVVRMIVEIASWLNTCRAVGSGHRTALAEYEHDPTGPSTQFSDPALDVLEARVNSLGERIARIDSSIRSDRTNGSEHSNVVSQLAALTHAAGSGCFHH